MTLPLKQYLALLGRYLRDQRQRVVWLGIFTVVGIGLQLMPPQLMRQFIDGVTAGEPLDVLIKTALLLIGVALGQQGVTIFTRYLADSITWLSGSKKT